METFALYSVSVLKYTGNLCSSFGLFSDRTIILVVFWKSIQNEPNKFKYDFKWVWGNWYEFSFWKLLFIGPYEIVLYTVKFHRHTNFDRNSIRLHMVSVWGNLFLEREIIFPFFFGLRYTSEIMHEMEKDILDHLVSNAIFFNSLFMMNSLVFDNSIYLIGPLPDTLCKIYILNKNLVAIGQAFCLQVICVLR